MIGVLTPIDAVQILGAAGTLAIALAAFIKSRPEGNKLEAEADLIRVEAQAKVIDSIQDELNRKDREIADLRKTIRSERQDFQRQLASLRDECDRLRTRISSMEVRQTQQER